MSKFRARRASPPASFRSIPFRRPASATSRYSAPLSSRAHPRLFAAARLTVPFPDPEGPSIVTTGASRIGFWLLGRKFGEVEPDTASHGDKARKRGRHIGHVPDQNWLCRPQAGHAEGHRYAVIAVTVDLAAAERRALRAPLNAHAVRQNLVSHAQGFESAAHGRDSIAFLDAQLLGARDHGLASRTGGRDEQHGKFVDSKRHQRGGHHRALERRGTY